VAGVAALVVRVVLRRARSIALPPSADPPAWRLEPVT
jgi:hypothetical protein